MTKPEWGQKRTCQACSARFYDMKNNPATCPKCGKEFDPSATTKKRRGRPPAADKKKVETPKKKEPEAEVEVEEVLEVTVEDATLIETDDEDLELEEKEVISNTAIEKED